MGLDLGLHRLQLDLAFLLLLTAHCLEQLGYRSHQAGEPAGQYADFIMLVQLKADAEVSPLETFDLLGQVAERVAEIAGDNRGSHDEHN